MSEQDEIYTVGELQEVLNEYTDNTHVRVLNDGERDLPSLFYDEETGELVL